MKDKSVTAILFATIIIASASAVVPMVNAGEETIILPPDNPEQGEPPPEWTPDWYVKTPGFGSMSGDCWENAMGTIENAITNASPNDTIIVGDGTYPENLNVDKENLTIRSENGAAITIVQTPYSDVYVFEVTTSGVSIIGFTVENATGSYKAGVFLSGSDNCDISNNICSNNSVGIHLWNSSNYNTLSNNTCENNSPYFGILLFSSSNNVLLNNTCENNSWDGIHLDYYSDNNLISNNTCKNNEHGIFLWDSDNNTLDNNTCSNNVRNGISIWENSDNNTISNNTCKNNEHGIFLWDSDNNTLVNNTCSNNVYNGISIWENSDNNTISNNTCQGNIDHGIYLEDSDNNTISNNTCENNFDGINLGYSSNNTISNNTCKNNEHGILLESSDNNTIKNNICGNNVYNGISLFDYSPNNTLDNNTCKNNEHGIFLWDSDNNTIKNNICENNNHNGIFLNTSDNNLISNNTAGNSQFYHGISLWNSDNNTLSNNTCSNNSNEHGITLFDTSANNTLTNNTCSNNEIGIFLRNSYNNTLYNNTCSNNEWDGINLYYYYYDGIYLGSDNNTLTNNICKNNDRDGIALSYSGNNMIDNNIAESNSVGIFLNRSDNNLISNNLAVRNYTGIYIQDYSDNNRIFHNNFVNNTNQAHDSCSNYWDNGYPSGGNYWSDYTGADNYQGENQDIPGSDGIGDTPYYIPAGSNQDRYPIMSLFPFRDVGVEIAPIYREGPAKATLTYIVTVTNLGTENDNYDLTVSDDAGWGPTLSDNLLEVPAGENGQTTLSVTVPEDALPCIEDTITVIVTSQANNRIKDIRSCKAHAISPVSVEISPTYQDGPAKATLTYIVTVKNIGTENDNYDLTLSDDAGWAPTLSDNLLEVPAGENGQTTLSVTVPENAPPCTEDTITVIATSQADNRVKDPSSCKAHAISPKAEFSLVTLYEVRLDVNLYLEEGSKLVVKFYTYEDAFENESVSENFAPPAHIVKFESVGHPENIAVKKVRLDLTTDDTENVISTIASFVVRRSDLMKRISAIKSRWPYASPPERSDLMKEISGIKGQWSFAPA